MTDVNMPKFHEFLAPILRFASDNKEHSLEEIIEEMAKKFKLNDEQRNLLMTNGKRTYLYDRVAWAITYLVQANLLNRIKRSRFIISELGKNELNSLPVSIHYTYLEKFPSYVEFRQPRHAKKQTNSDYTSIPNTTELTPDEEIESIFKNRDKILAKDLLDNLVNIKPSDFERVIIDLVLSMGYGKDFEEMAKVIGKPGDEGIDGEISQDKLGFDKIYLQAKRWDINQTVGAREIREFSGALSTKHAEKGIFITTANFSKEALETAKKDSDHKIILINGMGLAELMIEYNIGIREIKKYASKEIDKDYFESF